MTPNADGPDIATRYQQIIGLPPDTWLLFSTKWCEGQRSEHDHGRWRQSWAWMRDQPFRYRGGYHWIRSDSTPKAQAEFALRLMSEMDFGQPGDIWQTDWETTPGIRDLTAGEVAEYNDRVRQGLGEDRVITYCSDWVPGFDEWRLAHPHDALWYANYVIDPDRTDGGWREIERWNADLWQWTSRYPNNSCIRSYSEPGFDMNHIRTPATLDRIATLEDEMKVTTPRRLLDTRRQGQIAARTTTTVTVPNVKGAKIAQVTLTVPFAADPGHLIAWPAGKRPDTSVLNYQPGSVATETLFVPLDRNGAFKFWTLSNIHAVVDFTGITG